MATKTWTGAVNSNPNTPGNWSPSGVPANGDDVVIPVGSQAPWPVGSFAVAKSFPSLTVHSDGGTLDLTNVSVTGTLTVNSVGDSLIQNASALNDIVVSLSNCSVTIDNFPSLIGTVTGFVGGVGSTLTFSRCTINRSLDLGPDVVFYGPCTLPAGQTLVLYPNAPVILNALNGAGLVRAAIGPTVFLDASAFTGTIDIASQTGQPSTLDCGSVSGAIVSAQKIIVGNDGVLSNATISSAVGAIEIGSGATLSNVVFANGRTLLGTLHPAFHSGVIAGSIG